MLKCKKNIESPLPEPKYLWFLTLSYTMVTVISNWYEPRFVQFLGVDARASTLIFPLAFLLSDLITEVYGFKMARRAIWCGFLFNLIFLAFGHLITHLPTPNNVYIHQNALFDAHLSTHTRIIIASIISCFCAEPLNSISMAKLKIKMQGKRLWFRLVLSTVLASGFDSLIFSTLAFYGTIGCAELVWMIAGMWIIKVMIEIAGLPISVLTAIKLKEAEQLDIYDRRTPFYMLSIESVYEARDNEFVPHSNRIATPSMH